MGSYFLFKAIHLIFMVAWFAGLFFLGRLLIYYQEANDKPDTERKAIQELCEGGMTRVLRIIVLPSALITVLFGLHLAGASKQFALPWLHVKLLLVFLFLGYNHYLLKLRKKLIAGAQMSSSKLRMLNELPFIFLIGISFLASTKSPAQSLVATFILVVIFVGLGVVYRLRAK